MPEAGQSTCFFVYLTLVLGFSPMNVAVYICFVGILSTICQTVMLSTLIKYVGAKKTIMIGLTAQLIQLVWYGLGTSIWGVWAAGVFVAISSITYAAISAYLSLDTDHDKQGAVQGTLMGARGLCNGLGPAAFGLLFYLFGINIVEEGGFNETKISNMTDSITNTTLEIVKEWNGIINVGRNSTIYSEINEGEEESSILAVIVRSFPGIPFILMSSCVIAALIMAVFLEDIKKGMNVNNKKEEAQHANSQSENSETPIDIKQSKNGLEVYIDTSEAA